LKNFRIKELLAPKLSKTFQKKTKCFHEKINKKKWIVLQKVI